jgi:hypothetical protein
VVNNGQYVEYETTHELAHIWDNECGGCMQTGFVNATGGSESGSGSTYVYRPRTAPPIPGHDTTGWEDWADSVTTYLYPDYPKSYNGNPLDSARYSAVDRAFNPKEMAK